MDEETSCDELENGDDELAEWHEEKGNGFLDFAKFYKKEATKALKRLRGDRFMNVRILGPGDCFSTGIYRRITACCYPFFDSPITVVKNHPSHSSRPSW